MGPKRELAELLADVTFDRVGTGAYFGEMALAGELRAARKVASS
jgi:hypothetical protein